MARTVAAIQTEILDSITAKPELAGLDSPSATAIYKLIAFVVAMAIYTHEKLWDIMKGELEEIASSAKPGTHLWYQKRALEFQYGDPLVFIDEAPTYDPINITHRVVARAAVGTQPDGILLIKVAKLTGAVLEPLSAPELTSFTTYIDQIKFAGTRSAVISLAPDKVKITGKVYFNALVDLAVISASIEQQVLACLAVPEFNGELSKLKIIDAIQLATGVKDFTLTAFEGDDGSGYTIVDRAYQPLSGYCVIDPSAGLDLTLTYEAL